jgi:hypothetical protein
MALKKSELYSSLWASCDELRGGMDASQYKDYVLVLLFVKYVSDRYADEPYAPISIPKNASFADMVALKGKTDIGDQINKKILGPLAQANKLSDMPDFNDPNIRQLLSNQRPEFNQWFFTTVQIVVAGNDTEGLRYGTIGSPRSISSNGRKTRQTTLDSSSTNIYSRCVARSGLSNSYTTSYFLTAASRNCQGCTSISGSRLRNSA